MINIIETSRPNLCFVGDIHGDFKSIKTLMKHTEMTDTTYIFAGDCGFGFCKDDYYTNNFNKLNKIASEFNNQCIFVRGNHDDKEYFNGHRINRKYFKAVPDYTILKTPNHNVLCVGGAISIDRTHRINAEIENAFKYQKYHHCSLEEAKKLCPKYYWPNEIPVYDEKILDEIKNCGINIDIVCTHTCPSFAQPTQKDGIHYWTRMDEFLDDDINNERNVMDSVFKKLISDGHNITKWFYGHYHYHNQEFINNTQFVMLDMCRNGICDCFTIYY